MDVLSGTNRKLKKQSQLEKELILKIREDHQKIEKMMKDQLKNNVIIKRPK